MGSNPTSVGQSAVTLLSVASFFFLSFSPLSPFSPPYGTAHGVSIARRKALKPLLRISFLLLTVTPWPVAGNQRTPPSQALNWAHCHLLAGGGLVTFMYYRYLSSS
ncbi:hypothetical protein B0T22DRAFT_46568 [Podospora appendiculata]|uniref:Uncharacterized protein n=1 Tax=Podospora appendiculata TaxID=314037 RepID=A0AAE0XHN4_9PEZI|nr:hypothetical protein B0T22DRAFT_46568 [Podospora appendiculata]